VNNFLKVDWRFLTKLDQTVILYVIRLDCTIVYKEELDSCPSGWTEQLSIRLDIGQLST
jgi:hypothetical protein